MITITALASGSKGNCYYVTDGKTPLLLECGIPWKEIQRGLNFKTSDIAGCLISHDHKDHCKALKDTVKAGIDCHMSKGTGEALKATGHRIKTVKAREQFKVGTWTILPFETEHDAVEPLGYLLANQDSEKLLYITDTFYCRYRFSGINYIMIECNHSYDILRANVEAGLLDPELKNRLIKSHFSMENVKEFLKANDLSKVQEIWLIHLSDGNSDEARFKREIQELTGKMTYIT